MPPPPPRFGSEKMVGFGRQKGIEMSNTESADHAQERSPGIPLTVQAGLQIEAEWKARISRLTTRFRDLNFWACNVSNDAQKAAQALDALHESTRKLGESISKATLLIDHSDRSPEASK